CPLTPNKNCPVGSPLRADTLEGKAKGLPGTAVNAPPEPIENAATAVEFRPAAAYRNLLCPSVVISFGLTPEVPNGLPDTTVNVPSEFTVKTEICCPAASPTKSRLLEASVAIESPPITATGLVPMLERNPVVESIEKL